VLAAPSVPQAVVEYPPRDLVIKAGRVVWDAAAGRHEPGPSI
jgi:hypothetical protein